MENRSSIQQKPAAGYLVGGDKIAGDNVGDDKITADQVQGDIVAGDKVVQVLQIDLPRLMEVLRQSLPDDDPAPTHLIEALRQFKDYHPRLSHWKELHNQLNDILFNYGQFSREVERLAVSHEEPEPRTIGIHWRPVAQKVAILLDWASAPRSIFEGEPFARLEDRITGPLWAVELCVASDRLDDLMRPPGPPRLFVLPRPRPRRAPFIWISVNCMTPDQNFMISPSVRCTLQTVSFARRRRSCSIFPG